MFGHARQELVNKRLHVVHGLLDARAEIAVGKQRRNGDRETRDGREQRAGDAGRDGVHLDLARLCDDGEGDHHADDGAEQAEIRSASDADGEEDELAVELLHLAHEPGVQRGLDRRDRWR